LRTTEPVLNFEGLVPRQVAFRGLFQSKTKQRFNTPQCYICICKCNFPQLVNHQRGDGMFQPSLPALYAELSKSIYQQQQQQHQQHQHVPFTPTSLPQYTMPGMFAHNGYPLADAPWMTHSSTTMFPFPSRFPMCQTQQVVRFFDNKIKLTVYSQARVMLESWINTSYSQVSSNVKPDTALPGNNSTFLPNFYPMPNMAPAKASLELGLVTNPAQG